MKIVAIPTLQDNYVWILHDHCHAIAIDVGEYAPVRDYLRAHKLDLVAIWLTHQHFDHIDGVKMLKGDYQDSQIIAHASFAPNLQVPIDRAVDDGDCIDCLGNSAQVVRVDGHSAVHLAFVYGRHIFCGDALFLAGCGRVIDGNIDDLIHSIVRLYKLGMTLDTPDAPVLYYPAHEYSVANLAFAHTLDPSCQATHARLRHIQNLRIDNKISLPTSYVDECATNPYFRALSDDAYGARLAMAHGAPKDSHALCKFIRNQKDRA